MRKLTAAVFTLITVIVLGTLIVVAMRPKDTTQGTNTSSSSNTTTNTTQTNQNQTNSAGAITMRSMMFTPSQISVKTGDTVTWTNDDDVAHTVVVDQGDGPKSDQIQPGGTYSYTFAKAGSYQYHCSLHSSMRGTIVVK